MGKSLPRKCNACAKTYKTDFVRHAQTCKAGFKGWTFLDHAKNVIPKEKLKRMPNRIYDATDGVSVIAHTFDLTDRARAWSKFKRLGAPACSVAECFDALNHQVELIRAHPKMPPGHLKVALKKLLVKLK